MINIPEEVKTLLKKDNVRKNFRVHFPNGERADILMENINEESVTLSESLCSDNSLQFGSSESPTIEFETVGVENIKGKTIECSIDIDCNDCVEQATKGYNGTTPSATGNVRETLVIDDNEYVGTVNVTIYNYAINGSSTVTMRYSYEFDDETIFNKTYEARYPVIPNTVNISTAVFNIEVPEGKKLVSVLVEVNSAKSQIKTSVARVILSGAILPSWVEQKSDLPWRSYSIPYGKFVVDSCKKQADMNRRKIVGYSANELAYETLAPNDLVLLSESVRYNQTYKYDVIKKAFVYAKSVPLDNFTLTEVSKSTRDGDIADLHIYLNGLGSSDYDEIIAVNGYGTGKTINAASDKNLYAVEIGNTILSKDEIVLSLIGFVRAAILEINASKGTSYTYEQQYTTAIRDYVDATYNSVVARGIYWNGSGYYPVPAKIRSYSEKVIANNNEVLSKSGTALFYPYLSPSAKETTALNNMLGCLTGYRLSYIAEGWEKNPNIDIRNEADVHIYTLNHPLFNVFYATSERSKSSNAYKVTEPFEYQNARQILESVIELQGMFGISTRDGFFTIKPINQNFETVNAGTLLPSDYSTIWYEDEISKPIGRIECIYKISDDEQGYAYEDLVDDYSSAQYKSYDISQNRLIASNNLTYEKIHSIMASMGENIKNISYMPMDMTMMGHPEIEVGDVFNVQLDDGSNFIGLVETRVLSGINALVDSIVSKDEWSSQTSGGSSGGGGGTVVGAVTSVNGYVGAVQLTASDVDALPNSTEIPTKTSQLQNDSGFLTQHQDISGKQDKLTAGQNITISEDNVISATGGSGTVDEYKIGDVLNINYQPVLFGNSTTEGTGTILLDRPIQKGASVICSDITLIRGNGTSTNLTTDAIAIGVTDSEAYANTRRRLGVTVTTSGKTRYMVYMLAGLRLAVVAGTSASSIDFDGAN